jgi:hypothetical protein
MGQSGFDGLASTIHFVSFSHHFGWIRLKSLRMSLPVLWELRRRGDGAGLPASMYRGSMRSFFAMQKAAARVAIRVFV